MSSEVVVSCRGVGKSYQTYERPAQRLIQTFTRRPTRLDERFDALRDVTFDLHARESIGIIGENGSGKSTLLQIICGTLSPTYGKINVRGRIAALLELGSGFNPEFTGRENVLLNGAILGLTRSQIQERFDSIEAFADIGSHIDMPVKTYSSGMYVRLAFAIAAHIDADTLVVDEALSVGDVRFAQKCMRYMRAFRERGTLLFVSHDAGAVMNLCDRAIWLDHGKMRMDGPAKQVVESYLAEQHARDRAEFGDVVDNKVSAFRGSGKKVIVETDCRQDLIDSSSRRSLIQVFEFSGQTGGFGAGGARFEDAQLLGENGRPQSLVLGGELVTLRLEFLALQELNAVIVGFYLKDRLGQRLFGDNTYLSTISQPVALHAGQRGEARFTFRMPLLHSGDYSFDIAIATGDQENHTQQVWVHDALAVRGNQTTAVGGLVGIPMRDVSLSVVNEEQ